MANKVTFTMNNVPAGLDSMYVRVEEDALTAGVRNVLHSGIQAVTGNTIDIDIGENGIVGNGAIISADNYISGGAAFKSMTGYALIEAGDAPEVTSYTYSLNGEGQSYRLENRIVDVDNLAGLRFKFFQDSVADGSLLAQAGSVTGSKEFQVYFINEELTIIIGGEIVKVLDATWGWFDISFPTNSSMIVIINGHEKYNGAITVGAVREPDQPFLIGAREGGFYKTGIINNFEVYQDDLLVTSIPFKNKDSGAIQVDTVGGNNATIVNYSEDGWIEHYDSDITRVVVIGASIMNYTYGGAGDLSLGQDQFYNNHVSIELYNEAVNGHLSGNTANLVETLVTKYSSSMLSTLFVMHSGGGDCTINGPYPGGAASLEANLRRTCATIQNAGGRIAMTPISYRIPPASNPPEPYNENVVSVVIADLADYTFDLYTLSFENQDVWFDADNKHPNLTGEQLNREYIASVIAPQIIL